MTKRKEQKGNIIGASVQEGRLRRVLTRLAQDGAFIAMRREGGGVSDASETDRPDALLFSGRRSVAKPLDRLTWREVDELRRRDWVLATGARDTLVIRFKISAAGRAAAARRASAERVASQAAPKDAVRPGLTSGVGAATRNVAESPLAWLARRKGSNGDPFLSRAEVEAGERFRSDFETAQMGPRLAQDWGRFLAVVDEGARRSRDAVGSPAKDRVVAALQALGPGLGDAVLRVCCFLEGLERLEKREGWSARSGKVVLKIGLARLAEHYGLEHTARHTGRIETWRSCE
ncbi:MAG: DUF6456 domain-containing protein [Pseudomonadota bacterium]